MTNDILKVKNLKIKKIGNIKFISIIHNKSRQNSISNFKSNKNRNLIIKISIINILTNIFLACLKLFAGYFGKSYALITDAFHSFSDVFVNVLVILGVKISSKKADNKYKYGYERFECALSIILSFILFTVGLFIALNNFERLTKKETVESLTPNMVALIISIVSVVTKILMFIISFIIAKKTNSNILKADAFHNLSDTFSLVGIFIGIIGSMLGFSFMDLVASIFICLLIFKVSIDVFVDSIKKMIDRSAPSEIEKEIENIIMNRSYSDGCEIKTRLFGNFIMVDADVIVNDNLSLSEQGYFINKLENDIKFKNEMVKDCKVRFVYKNNKN